MTTPPCRDGEAILSGLPRMVVATLLVFGALEAAPRPRPASGSVARPDAALLKARWHVLGARPLGMYYYYAPGGGFESLEQHATQITLLAPQCFWVDSEGFVQGEVPPQVAELARRAALPVMPLLINPGFDRAKASAFLRNPRAQERAVMYLAYLARRDNFVGWQLDLEYLDPADKLLYVRFVQRAAARLHKESRLLSVAVVPRFSDVYPDSARAGEFRTSEWGAPYDFRALGRWADFLTLMTYDHHGNNTAPGPVAGYDWVKAALDYAVPRVPRSKLLLGIPFYGREWVETPQGTKSNTLAFEDVKSLLGRPGTEARWDERWRTTSLLCREAGTQRTAWFDDSRSLREKLKLMQKYRLRGFAAWRLGVEDPQFWPMVAEFKARAPAVPGRQATKKRARAAPVGSAAQAR